jgi:hypothetical protein
MKILQIGTIMTELMLGQQQAEITLQRMEQAQLSLDILIG